MSEFTKISVDSETVVRTLREVVAERPDHVYQCPPNTQYACMYVHGDAPGCVVGCVLHRLGVPLEVLSQHEGQTAYMLVPKVLDIRTSADSVTTLLDCMQTLQDCGKPWNDALARAESVAGTGAV